jgi:hypothetical protein
MVFSVRYEPNTYILLKSASSFKGFRFEGFTLLGYKALQCGESQPTFRRNISPPSWMPKSKPSKKLRLRCRRYTPRERRLNFTRLHAVISSQTTFWEPQIRRVKNYKNIILWFKSRSPKQFHPFWIFLPYFFKEFYISPCMLIVPSISYLLYFITLITSWEEQLRKIVLCNFLYLYIKLRLFVIHLMD